MFRHRKCVQGCVGVGVWGWVGGDGVTLCLRFNQNNANVSWVVVDNVKIQIFMEENVLDAIFCHWDPHKIISTNCYVLIDDVMKWKHFRVTGPLWGGIHRSPVNSPRKGPVTRTFDISLLLVWTNGWTNNRLTRNSRRCGGHLTSP